MAVSIIYPHKKIYGPHRKRSEAALKRYESADIRLWHSESNQRSIGLQNILARDSLDTENLSREQLVKEINGLLKDIKVYCLWNYLVVTL